MDKSPAASANSTAATVQIVAGQALAVACWAKFAFVASMLVNYDSWMQIVQALGIWLQAWCESFTYPSNVHGKRVCRVPLLTRPTEAKTPSGLSTIAELRQLVSTCRTNCNNDFSNQSRAPLALQICSLGTSEFSFCEEWQVSHIGKPAG